MNCKPVFKRVHNAARSLKQADSSLINSTLDLLAHEIVRKTDFILEENKKDLNRMDSSDPRYDRLLLSPQRLASIAADIRTIAILRDPVGKLLSEDIRPNGLKIQKISVPFGVVGVIFESRPNVVPDVFCLCLKSRNGCVLKGGSDASSSNAALISIIKKAMSDSGLDQDAVELLPPGRSETGQLLKAVDYIDLVIPRGGRGLIDFVRKNAIVPVIETGAGICHTYFDRSGDKDKGRIIINNAKTRRVSVCNALDCLVIHKDRLADLPFLLELCSKQDVEVFADPAAYKSLAGHYPGNLLHKATPDSFGTEFLSYKMSVKTVSSLEEALLHIEKFGSKHSEAIIADDSNAVSLFMQMVDASSVYSNTSTAFTDGAQFGLGAEIGISTQKLHARGPMALAELTTYKWLIEGNGQVRT